MSYIYVCFSIPGKDYVYFDIVNLLMAVVTTVKELIVVQSI